MTRTLDSDGVVGLFASMRVVDGCPAVSYYDDDEGDLKYAIQF